MKYLLTLFAMCLFMTFFYPLMFPKAGDLIDVAVLLGVFACIIVFFTIVVLVCMELNLKRDLKEKFANVKIQKFKNNDSDYVDAEYYEEEV